MIGNTPLLSILVIGLTLAFIFGYTAHRFNVSPILGYLFAGVLIGPTTPGFNGDPAIASGLAEIGIILLMFGVGLHFSIHDLNHVKKIAIPGAILQMIIATLMGMIFTYTLGWDLISSFVFGFAISVASTVVLVKTLEEWQLLNTINGKIAIAWLVVEDLLVVFLLIFLPPLAAINGYGNETPSLFHHETLKLLGITFLKTFGFIALMMVLGKRIIPKLLQEIAHDGSNELFRLAVLSVALAIAFVASKLFGISFALGAFFAGMILNESSLSQRAAEETLPLREAFSVLFFISVGMLFQPAIIIAEPWLVLITCTLILIGKSIVSFIIVKLFRYSFYTALTIAVSLAQIGEFSFIMAEIGYKLNLLSEEGKDLIIASAFVSIALNPFLFNAIQWLRGAKIKIKKKRINLK